MGFSVGEVTSAIVCGCLPALRRAWISLALSSKISQLSLNPWEPKPHASTGAFLNARGAVGFELPSTPKHVSDDKLELQDLNSKQNNHETSIAGARGPKMSDSETGSFASMV